MFKDRFLGAMLFLSISAIVVMPIYSVTKTIPELAELLVEDSENDAVRIAMPLASKFFPEEGEVSPGALPPGFMANARSMQHDFKLWKLKVFSLTGETLYSSDANDIGKMNNNNYFHNIVAKGRNHTKIVRRNTQSLEGEMVHMDVVETYVPVMRGGTFVGAFEIYLDITYSTAKIDRVIKKSNVMLSVISGSFLGIVFLTAVKAGRSLKERNRVEKEKETLITDLQNAITEIKTLQGILPICCSCKKIRDDMGSWTQVEAYIQNHSQAEFSHGYCPECAQKAKAEFREYMKTKGPQTGRDGTPEPSRDNRGLTGGARDAEST